MNRDGAMYGNGRNMRGMMGSRPGMGTPPDGRSRGADSCGCATDGYSRVAKDCACTEDYSRTADVPEIPSGNPCQLLQYLDEASFCAYDLMLYLDTHPNDENAREAFRGYKHKRDHALRLYEEKYGPLRYGQGSPGAPCSIKWIRQTWPWEGGEN
ncbi:MAG: spore coat protein CotJB [Clostridiales bacterium]|nr:spore coat protein CotJB [Clostridiales bacterium]